MRLFFPVLTVAALLAFGPPAVAQLPTYQSVPADLDGSAAEACSRTHSGPGAARPAYASPGHRQKMDRYDVRYYKLDLRLTNTTRDVSGVVTMLARTGAQSLDSLAFELFSTYTIDSVVVDGRRSLGLTRRGLGDVTVGLGRAVNSNTLFRALRLLPRHGTQWQLGRHRQCPEHPRGAHL